MTQRVLLGCLFKLFLFIYVYAYVFKNCNLRNRLYMRWNQNNSLCYKMGLFCEIADRTIEVPAAGLDP